MQDLYREVNGEWLDTHVIPADRASDGAFYELRDDAEAAVHELVARDEGLPGTLFRLFLDTRGQLQDLEEDLAPLRAATTVEEVMSAMGALDRSGVGGPVGFYISKDAQGTVDVAYLVQSGLGLPDKEYYTAEVHEELRADYTRHVALMLGLLHDAGVGGAADISDPAAAAEKIVALESQLAAAHWDREDARDAIKTYNPTTVDELPPHTRAFAQAAGIHGRVINRNPSFLPAVEALDDLEAVKLWATWRVLASRAALLSDEVSRANFDFYGTRLAGTTEQRARWKRAVAFAEGHVGEEIGKLYVAAHFPSTHKAEMMNLVDYLLGAYNERIRQLSWMTEDTKAKALEKLAKFTPNIGYPDRWRSYEGLHVDAAAGLVAAERACNRFNHDFEIAKLGKPHDASEWHMTPQTVNAYYTPLTNSITFPAAILQAPFYSPEQSDAANFGGIGAVIGHEIGHGFDDQGSRYDGDGRLESWWTDADRAAFEELTSKLVAQFDGKIPAVLADVDGITGVNGRFTLGENIGDLGGLGIALVAYLHYADDVSDEDLREFFTNWARVWRSKTRPEMAAQLLTIDPHSPAEFRCNIIAANIDDFYRAFDVDEDAPMYIAPDERVQIW
ncbi:peptidase M13 [Corynebacterium sp. 13CS0277]|uniref:M13 family metallopeptidase n=1 Tax=Corynebacterium sp. 13CS0277 TaxID=2071994 RepID=UPI000D03EFD7|nr:M13-type metalloendopeptidase [Corynebacterium sp. 13CS0277]PRQ10381.1 peptidase M13 [Corynebacterium sp. 13CS0277]